MTSERRVSARFTCAPNQPPNALLCPPVKPVSRVKGDASSPIKWWPAAYARQFGESRRRDRDAVTYGEVVASPNDASMGAPDVGEAAVETVAQGMRRNA
jgi:hypothetical protein